MKETVTMDPIARAEGSVKKWKDDGGTIVGYSCSYLPVEVLHAAGILPVRLRGTGVGHADIGDTYFGPYICSYPKCILQRAGGGQYSHLDGTIITPGCDSMRRLDECWRKAGEDFENIVPGFFFHFGAPHKSAPHSMEWFTAEIRRLMGALESSFGVAPDEDALRQSVSLYNRGRELVASLDEYRKKPVSAVSGEESYALSVAGTLMQREEYVDYLAEFLEEVSGRKKGLHEGKPRFMVVGSVADDLQLVQMVESMGALVAAENLCFGTRHEGDLVHAGGDVIEALAEHYLEDSLCPRMFGAYQKRLENLKTRIREMDVDGVILQNIRFCDLHGSENAIFERDLEDEGIPCMRIEREYGALADTGRLRMRLDAFMETFA